MFHAMTYDQAKFLKAAASATSDHTGKLLSDISGKNGQLTPDSVRNTPEYKAVKHNFDIAFAYERKFNTWFLKTYKKEYAAERKAKYNAMSNLGKS